MAYVVARGYAAAPIEAAGRAVRLRAELGALADAAWHRVPQVLVNVARDDYDEAATQAKYVDGILELSLAKKANNAAKRITVQ